ncbi:membrane protein insertase YidC [Stenotrophobium rhamnosiphilum]|uniref:Membrane protein insertase YidC n=1 Tax=Stenotrophobium rhamnosiphilum TaxID=2029166 RepID=A0A2T5MFM8_9GAMM|nr:membrane protein insertase YidC [Stenotrophobium rhamnosiphilum]PTU31383.1 membrane protein insertase YidC [Stenotrophobium rhamnosiphilum]
MENRRFILIALLGAVLFFMYQAWVKDFAPAAVTPAETTANAAPAIADEIPTASTATAAKPAAAAETTTPGAAVESGARVHVQTDVLAIDISLTGGELRRVELVGYPVAKDQPNNNFALLSDKDHNWFVLQSGLATPEQPLSSPQTAFTSAQNSYKLADDASTLEVPLDFVAADGSTLRKTYRFKRGSYDIELVQSVKNAGAANISVSPYVRMWRTPPADSSSHHMGISTFTGVAFYEQKPESTNYRFKKLKFDELAEEPLNTKQQGGWIAMLQHYFAVAVIPPAGEANTFSAKPSATKGFLGQYVGSAAVVAPQTQHDFSTHLYIGPELQDGIGKPKEGDPLAFFDLHGMNTVAPGLEYAIDYGILTPIAKPLFWLLKKFHTLTGNWGFAIILLTLAVKGLLYKLSEAQYRSMAKMKKFAPRIADLKERYGDDRERMSKEMMNLYKKEGFNPLAGCWPLLLQFPIFMGLYWVLLQSVELRQAPFALWINDLSAADPYFVLPVLFGISMFVQQKLSGQQIADPMQQKVMQIMPIMMTAFFAFFPAGLVLYWFVSNLAGITQQWYITRKLENETPVRKTA